jgi:hypothetical protein
MNIFQKFIESMPISTPLDFGHNENVVVESVDFGDRKNKGIRIRANTFIRLTKVNPETRKAIASTEINFFDIDSTKDFAFDNMMSQFTVISGLISALGGDVNKYDEEVVGILDSTEESAIKKFLKSADNAKKVQNALVNGFKSQNLTFGLDSKLLKCKMINNSKGYIITASTMDWVLPMDSENNLPPISASELRMREKGLTRDRKAKPDSVGEAPRNNTTNESPKEIKASVNALDSI